MAAANPQPLQARPYEEHMQIPIQIDDDDGEYEVDALDGGSGGDAMDDPEEAQTSSLHPSGHGVVMASRTSELTLSFEGEVYVFPAVTPEKVFVSLLLRCFGQFGIFTFIFQINFTQELFRYFVLFLVEDTYTRKIFGTFQMVALY